MRFKRFTQADREFIRLQLHSMTNAQIGAALGRSESSIGWQITQMQLSRGRRRWKLEQIERMRGMYASHSRKSIAEHFGVTEMSIKMAMKTHGIKSGRSGLFVKGQVSHNKGKKMPEEWVTEEMKRTQFKKGNVPHNTKSNGAVTVRELQGRPYKFIRVASSKWALLHRYNYEKFIGSIPDQMYVTFRDGNSLNCEPDNLKLETKLEHMTRNSIMRFDAELRSVIRLLGKYKRKVKSYEEQN
jgi:DNA-binding CsgD family transcriptional regulator